MCVGRGRERERERGGERELPELGAPKENSREISNVLLRERGGESERKRSRERHREEAKEGGERERLCE